MHLFLENFKKTHQSLDVICNNSAVYDKSRDKGL
jgi:hypothetical protein